MFALLAPFLTIPVDALVIGGAPRTTDRQRIPVNQYEHAIPNEMS